jgi:hypothetical protein
MDHNVDLGTDLLHESGRQKYVLLGAARRERLSASPRVQTAQGGFDVCERLSEIDASKSLQSRDCLGDFH